MRGIQFTAHQRSTVVSTASLLAIKSTQSGTRAPHCLEPPSHHIPPIPHTARCPPPLADHVSDIWSSLCMFLRWLLTPPFMPARTVSEVLRVWRTVGKDSREPEPVVPRARSTLAKLFNYDNNEVPGSLPPSLTLLPAPSLRVHHRFSGYDG